MIQVIFTGNLGKDAELKTLPSGKEITVMNVGSTPRIKKNGEWADGETIWFQVTVWQALPPVLYVKGKTVQVVGTLEQDTYEKDGVKRTALKVTASSVGAITKIERREEPATDWAPRLGEVAPAAPKLDEIPF